MTKESRQRSLINRRTVLSLILVYKMTRLPYDYVTDDEKKEAVAIYTLSQYRSLSRGRKTKILNTQGYIAGIAIKS